MAQVRAVVRHSSLSKCAHDVCGSPSTLISPPSSSLGKASIDETHSPTGYEPNAYDFKETHVESYTELLTSPPSLSKQGFSPRTPSTMTPHSRICFVKLTEHIAITLNEKTCLSGQSSSVSETTGRLVGERAGRPAESSSQDAQIKILLEDTKGEFLPSASQINRHEFQAEELQR